MDFKHEGISYVSEYWTDLSECCGFSVIVIFLINYRYVIDYRFYDYVYFSEGTNKNILLYTLFILYRFCCLGIKC